MMVRLVDDPPSGDIVTLASRYWGNKVWDCRWKFVPIPKGFHGTPYLYPCRICLSKNNYYADDQVYVSVTPTENYCVKMGGFRIEVSDGRIELYMGLCQSCSTMYWGGK